MKTEISYHRLTTRRTLLGIGAATVAAKAMPDIPFVSTPKVAKAEGEEVAGVNTESAMAPNTITAAFTPENPGIFPNSTSNFADALIKDNTIDGALTPIDRLSQGFPVNGNLLFNVTMRIDNPTNVSSSSSGFKLQIGQPKQDDYNKVVLVLDNGEWRLRQRVGRTDTPVLDAFISNDVSSNTGTFSLDLSPEGNSISIGKADGSVVPVALPNPIFQNDNTLKVLLQQAPRETITLTQLEVTPTGFTIEAPPVPEPVPTPEPTPDQQTPAVENRFQFPDFSHPIERKIGDIDVDGFEILNMGKTKGLFVTDMDYARTAIQKHFGESGKRLRIVFYDKSSDMPKSLNITGPGLIRAFLRSDYKDSVEVANFLESYGRPVEDDNGIVTLHNAVDKDFGTTTPAYSRLAGHHDVFLQELVSRNISLWVTGLMRLNSKHIPPIQTGKPVEESAFEEELTFFSKPIIVATQKK